VNQLSEYRSLLKQTERLCIETDIDIAWGFLRLAEAEMELGNLAVAIEFLEKAILGCRTVIAELGNTVVELDEERSGLWENARKLFDSIVTFELRSFILYGS
jgi:hypothetical protein